MVHNIVTVLGLAVFLFGLFVFFTAVLGLFRFDYVLNRMHAAAVGDTLGLFCILIGLILLHGWSLAAVTAVVLGKTLGGFLADRFGLFRSAAASPPKNGSRGGHFAGRYQL